MCMKISLCNNQLLFILPMSMAMLDERNRHERDGKKSGKYTSVTKLLDIVCPLKTPDSLMIEKMPTC
jgi:hypothetical protein